MKLGEKYVSKDIKSEQDKKEVKSYLLKNIKPVRTVAIKENDPHLDRVETLEKIYHGIGIRYGYQCQGINEHYKKECIKGKVEYDKNINFVMYHASIITNNENGRKWIGNIYGQSMWEVYAKIIIKIYMHVKSEETKNEK